MSIVPSTSSCSPKKMAQLLALNPLRLCCSDLTRPKSHRILSSRFTSHRNAAGRWTNFTQGRRYSAKVHCLFSGNKKQEQAKKALESALGGKKDEFDKWNKEIKRRQEAGGGGDNGGGGWFGWGGRFGWSNGDHFWAEMKQTILTILGIVILYLITAKGDILLAVIFNPLVNVLRGTREGLTNLAAQILRLGRKDPYANNVDFSSKKEVYSQISAKERVLRKWGSD